MTKITDTLHEDQYTPFIISRSVLRMRHVSDRIVKKIETHVLCSVTFFFLENRAVYEIMWRNIADPDRPHMTIIRYTRIACWLHMTTYIHSEYVKLFAFPLQQWLRELAVISPLFGLFKYSAVFAFH